MEYISFDKVCDVFSGYAFKKFNDLKEGKPVIKIGNIKANGEINTNTCTFTEETPLEKFYSKKDDLYVALSGATTGKVGLMEAEGFLINQRVGIVRRIIDYVPIKYIHFFMNSITDRILKDAVGAAQPNISPKDILKYKFPLRSKEEMEEITRILAEISTAIIKNKENLIKIDEFIDSKFIEMFSNCSSKVRLGDCCEVHARIGWQALTRDEHMEKGDYMLITGTDFKDGEINFSTCVYVTKERYEMDRHIIMQNDDVLITKDGTIGKVAIVHNLPKPATLNSGVFVVRPDKRFNKEYISNVFKGPLFNEFVEASKTGATIKHLNQKHLVEFMIPVPTIEKQKEFANIILQINQTKLLIKKQIELLEELLEKKMNEYFK